LQGSSGQNGRQLAFDFIKRMISDPATTLKGNSPKKD
jgi:hypothetical protein